MAIAELATRLQAHHDGTMALPLHCEALGLMTKRPGHLHLPPIELILAPPGARISERPIVPFRMNGAFIECLSGSTLERKPARLPLGDAVRKLEGPVAPPLQ